MYFSSGRETEHEKSLTWTLESPVKFFMVNGQRGATGIQLSCWNYILQSEGRILDSPVHLQWCHLHIRDLGILKTSCRAVSSWSSHGTEPCCCPTNVGETWRTWNSRTPKEPSRCHKVPVSLRMREGVTWTAGACAPDAGASSWRGRCCFGLSHLEHHLKVWTEIKDQHDG